MILEETEEEEEGKLQKQVSHEAHPISGETRRSITL